MHSLRTKILAVVLVSLAFIGAAFVMYSMTAAANYKILRLENIRKTVDLEIEKVNKSIAMIERSAIYFALDGLLFQQSQSLNADKTSLLEYLRDFPDAIGGGFWFKPYAYNGKTLRAGVYAFFDHAGGGVRFDEIEPDYDYFSQNWYREIIEEIKKPYQVVWTKPYVDDSSYRLMTTAGAGIFDRDGNLIAISNIDWEIDRVIEKLTAIKPTLNSFVLMIAPRQDYVISGAGAMSAAGASIKDIPWDIYADSFTLDGVSYLQFRQVMDNGWLLSVEIPENEIISEMGRKNNRFSIIIAVFSFVMLGVAYSLISRLINAPIKQLMSGVSRIASGRLDTRIEISSKDELGLLARTFNRMTADLKESVEKIARENAEKERIGAELTIATNIQANMLPNVFPPFPERTEFDIYASMRPAKEVGGDFYDFFLLDKDNLAIVIADVSGKGIPAALFMVVAKTLIKNCSSCKRPKAVFESVNKKLCENNDSGMFVTSFIGFYNIPTGRLVFINAGHNPPLIKRQAGGVYEFLPTKPSPILGWLKNAEYREETVTLEQGDVLYLYTDGVTEAVNAGFELFSEARLLEALNRYNDRPPKELLDAIKQEIDNFADGAEQADDIAMLALKINETGCKKITVKAAIDNLRTAIDFLNAELERHKCPPDLQSQIDVAAEEIFTNIANYSYRPGGGDITIGVSAGDEAVIRFEDAGRSYNPLEQASPDLDKPLPERDIGGLGVFLVRQLMDEVEYKRVDNKNVLVMKKKLG